MIVDRRPNPEEVMIEEEEKELYGVKDEEENDDNEKQIWHSYECRSGPKSTKPVGFG